MLATTLKKLLLLTDVKLLLNFIKKLKIEFQET